MQRKGGGGKWKGQSRGVRASGMASGNQGDVANKRRKVGLRHRRPLKGEAYSSSARKETRRLKDTQERHERERAAGPSRRKKSRRDLENEGKENR